MQNIPVILSAALEMDSEMINMQIILHSWLHFFNPLIKHNKYELTHSVYFAEWHSPSFELKKI